MVSVTFAYPEKCELYELKPRGFLILAQCVCCSGDFVSEKIRSFFAVSRMHSASIGRYYSVSGDEVSNPDTEYRWYCFLLKKCMHVA
jgi:hypothetical protein